MLGKFLAKTNNHQLPGGKHIAHHLSWVQSQILKIVIGRSTFPSCIHASLPVFQCILNQVSQSSQLLHLLMHFLFIVNLEQMRHWVSIKQLNSYSLDIISHLSCRCFILCGFFFEVLKVLIKAFVSLAVCPSHPSPLRICYPQQHHRMHSSGFTETASRPSVGSSPTSQVRWLLTAGLALILINCGIVSLRMTVSE